MNTLKTISHPDIFAESSNDRPSIKKITYTYDSMNRRVARTDENGTYQYLYGNPNHPFQITAVRDHSGNLRVYHYDDFGLLLAIESDATWYYVTTDQLGTPQVVCDADGQVVKVLQYDSFGKQIADSNPAFELHISFAGGLADSDTELVRFGFRDYDSAAGKWTAKDPIGFAGGDGNLYGYVSNDAINFVDQIGLAGELVLLRFGRMVIGTVLRGSGKTPLTKGATGALKGAGGFAGKQAIGNKFDGLELVCAGVGGFVGGAIGSGWFTIPASIVGGMAGSSLCKWVKSEIEQMKKPDKCLIRKYPSSYYDEESDFFSDLFND